MDTEHPNEYLKKPLYIYEWLSVFDKSFANDELNVHSSIDKFSKYSKPQLKTAFEWSLKHFIDLGLGGNYRWYEATISVLNYQKRKLWNLESEKKLIGKYKSEMMGW
jgi:hypothetical protein